MRIPRIYTAQTLALGTRIELDASAAQHIVSVLRMSAQRPLILFNGNGGEYHGVISSAEKKRVVVELTEFNASDRQSPLNIELAIAISKGERMDLICQKATELGVTRITPLFTERVEVKLSGDRLEKKIQHWQHICIAACEQSGRNVPPQLSAPQALHSWLSTVTATSKLVLHHRTEQNLDTTTVPDSVALLIGPEGGLSEVEIGQALAQGFIPLALGPRILRTETAPLAAIAVLQYLWGDMNPR